MWPRRYASIGVNDGKPSNQRPTKSLILRLRNSSRCAASCISAANCAWARPIRTNAAIQTNQLSSRTASTTIAIVCAYSASTASALRVFGIRRSCSRNSGSAGPGAVMRSVGCTASRSDRVRDHRGGHVRHITLSRQMLREGNTTDLEPLLERPLSARSLVASLLLRTRPPRMRGSRLVQWCGLFGVAEGTTRVALSRMVERGELRSRDGVYELAGRVQSRRGAQDWSLDPVLGAGTGEWRSGVVAPGPEPPASGPRCVTPCVACVARRCAKACGPAPTTSRGRRRRPSRGRSSTRSVFGGRAVPTTIRWRSRRSCSTARAGRSAPRCSPGTCVVTVRGGSRRPGARRRIRRRRGVARAHRADPLLPPELVADASAAVALRTAYRTYEAAFSAALRAWFLQH